MISAVIFSDTVYTTVVAHYFDGDSATTVVSDMILSVLLLQTSTELHLFILEQMPSSIAECASCATHYYDVHRAFGSGRAPFAGAEIWPRSRQLTQPHEPACMHAMTGTGGMKN